MPALPTRPLRRILTLSSAAGLLAAFASAGAAHASFPGGEGSIAYVAANADGQRFALRTINLSTKRVRTLLRCRTTAASPGPPTRPTAAAWP